jgi:hypothetical protein
MFYETEDDDLIVIDLEGRSGDLATPGGGTPDPD